MNVLENASEHENRTGARKEQKKYDETKIEKLDRSQTALLYSYLQEVGAAKKLSSNSLAPLISKLTGHSENTLRTKSFDKIWEIKAGKVINIGASKGKPEYNLLMVKNVVIEILKIINEDIDKKRIAELKKAKIDADSHMRY